MWTKDTKKYLSEWGEHYRRDLLDDILPFWL